MSVFIFSGKLTQHVSTRSWVAENNEIYPNGTILPVERNRVVFLDSSRLIVCNKQLILMSLVFNQKISLSGWPQIEQKYKETSSDSDNLYATSTMTLEDKFTSLFSERGESQEAFGVALYLYLRRSLFPVTKR